MIRLILNVALLLRMDDPSSGIRILAASVIPFLRPRFGADEENNKEDRKVWETFIKYCLDLLYLHYDGPDQRLQAAIQGKFYYFCSCCWFKIGSLL